MFSGDADCVIVIPAASGNSIVILLLLGTGMLMDMGVLIQFLTPILLPIAKIGRHGFGPVLHRHEGQSRHWTCDAAGRHIAHCGAHPSSATPIRKQMVI